ncbi:MAG: HTTM domain-containing protein [Bdellovibrionales bacterium]|nr:HTTM domain-containing protein [Bdellovibrionales bacterium]
MRVLQMWNKFWFESGDSYSLGLFRLVFSGILLVTQSLRFLEFSLLYSDSGLLPFSLAKTFAPPNYQPLFYWFPENDIALKLCYIIYLGFLLAFSLGFIGRRLCWLILFFHLMFIQRNFTINYGADLVSNFFLFALCFTNSHRYFSLKKKIFPNWSMPPSHWLDSVGLRLIQVQLCVIYAFTGLEKMKGTEWWEGTAVWTVLTNSQLAPFDFSFFAYVPLVVVAMTWATLLFEVYFPVVIWFRHLRPYWLLLGFSFHAGAAFFMSLPFFSMIMVSGYIVFLSQDQWAWFIHRGRQLLKFES